MPLTIDKASDDVAFIFINLATDNLKKPEDKDANETAAHTKFDKMIVKITECNFTPAQLKKLCKEIETKIVGYAEMTRDIPGAYEHPSSAKPLMRKTELDAIREKLAKDACDCFDSFSKGTIIDLGSKGGAHRRRNRSSRRQNRSRRQNKSQKRR
jgi:hypothetical protein